MTKIMTKLKWCTLMMAAFKFSYFLLLSTPGSDDGELVTPHSEEEDEDDDPDISGVRPGVTTAQLAREAAASADINTRKRNAEQDKRTTAAPPAKRTARAATTPATVQTSGRRESVSVVEEVRRERTLPGFRIPFKNSTKYPKDARPAHLQDDDIFDMLSISDVTNQMAMWEQTKVMMESNTLKVKKAEKGAVHKTNTAIKKIKVQEGEDDATTIFHPQRFQLRPPVVSMEKVWDMYPTHWPQTYYSVHLTDLGLDTTLGQKVIELLQDRRSTIQIKMFAPSNSNVGRSGFKKTNLKTGEDGSTDVVTTDEWAKLVTLNELLLSLDNLVAAWGVFWWGDRCMNILRRVVTKHKEFGLIKDAEKRFKSLEMFINKVLEINARKATQGEICMSYKEAFELGSEYLENVNEYVALSGGVSQPQQHQGGGGSGQGGKQGRGAAGRAGQTVEEFSRGVMERALRGQRVGGKEVCIEYNLKNDKGDSQCKDRKCSKAHNCGFFTRGESKPCGGRHPKFEHKR